MNNSFELYVIFSISTLLIGIMFVGGFLRGKWILAKGMNIDLIMFKSIKDKRTFKSGDQLVFCVCLLMSLCIFINGILAYIIPDMPNISAIFLFVAFPLSLPIRIVFILLNYNKRYRDVPRIWPFSKAAK